MRQGLIAVASLLAVSCGKQAEAPPAKTAVEPPKTVEDFHPDPATVGTPTGKAFFQGPKPAGRVISMDSEAVCQKAHAGKPVYDEPLMVAKNGSLANAFVYVQSGLEGKKFEPPKETVVLDQHGCMFVPRIIGI